jgi:hypothetical protein
MASSRPWPFDDDDDRPSGSVRPLSQANLQAILAHLGDDPDQLLVGTGADRPVVTVRVRASVGRPGGSAQATRPPPGWPGQQRGQEPTRLPDRSVARSPWATGGVSQRGWDAGRRARAAQRACGQVGALGALLSSNDFGSSVERYGVGHPL